MIKKVCKKSYRIQQFENIQNKKNDTEFKKYTESKKNHTELENY